MKKHSFAIKVCGITRQSDLSTAMGMGAHFCGFIFHPGSPRYIAPSRAAALDSALIRRVGVFVNQNAEEIMDIMKTARLEFAQLHGAHSLDCARRIGPEKVIRVLWPDRYESVDTLQREMELWADSCAWFLLDAGPQGGEAPEGGLHILGKRDVCHRAGAGSQGGGHGVSLDWTSLASLSSPRPWFLAGGLSSASLNRALEQCSPDGIDLNSGVEAIPGQKSPQKLLAALKPLTPYTPYHIA